MSNNHTYNLTYICKPVASQPVAVEMPADIDMNSLNQLLNSHPVPMQLRVQLPYGTRLLALRQFAQREGLQMTCNDNLIRFYRSENSGLLKRAKDFIFQPQSF